MSIRVGLRPMARPALAVPVRCGARGDMAALFMGTYLSGTRLSAWDARELMEFLGYTVDYLAMATTIPELCPYSLLWIGIPHPHGAFSAGELAAIKAFVEDQGGSLIVLADTDEWHDVGPLNQLAGIWGGAHSTVLNAYAVRPTAGQGTHDLWVTPTKGIGLQYATRYDTRISTIATGFTQYADTVTKIAVYREFPSGGRVIFSMHNAIMDHDGWLINFLKWIDGAKAEVFTDDLADLDDWNLTEQTMHDVTIQDGTWVRFEPIANADSGWSPVSSVIHTLASPISGDFLFAFNWRYYQPSNTPISSFYVQLLDAEDNVVAQWGLGDSWAANTGALRSASCDTSWTSGSGSMPLSGHFRMSIYRIDDMIHLCSGVLQGGDTFGGTGAYYQHGVCTRTVAKIKIRYAHYAHYWTATEYYDVDKVGIWS